MSVQASESSIDGRKNLRNHIPPGSRSEGLSRIAEARLPDAVESACSYTVAEGDSFLRSCGLVGLWVSFITHESACS